MTVIRLVSRVGVHTDLAMLPHFLRHYPARGIARSRMHIILQATGPCPELDSAKAMLRGVGTAPPEIWTAAYTSDAMWEKRRVAQRKHATADDWVVSADVCGGG